MLVILSPAKTMDMSVVEQELPGTTPEYTAEAEYLAEHMRHFSASELEKMLKISPKLAAENYERYQRFGSLSNSRKQALFAYNGSVFKAIDPNSFSLEDLKYAQDRVRIISTLYGLVRPLDLIQAYRIAFSVKLDGANLYDYWVPKLTTPLLEDGWRDYGESGQYGYSGSVEDGRVEERGEGDYTGISGMAGW